MIGTDNGLQPVWCNVFNKMNICQLATIFTHHITSWNHSGPRLMPRSSKSICVFCMHPGWRPPESKGTEYLNTQFRSIETVPDHLMRRIFGYQICARAFLFGKPLDGIHRINMDHDYLPKAFVSLLSSGNPHGHCQMSISAYVWHHYLSIWHPVQCRFI